MRQAAETKSAGSGDLWFLEQGDCRELLREMESDSVDCVVTSPPYYGLRDYGVAGQMGREASPGEFLDGLTAVFEEVRRVLKPAGTCWVNMGDSYAGRNGGPQGGTGQRADRSFTMDHRVATPAGYKPKDLLGMPWELAFRLRAAGWWLRQDIIWHKPNPMPESIGDRCTKAHEYLFLLTKSERYHFDAGAIAEPASEAMLAQMRDGYEGQSTKLFDEAGAQDASGTKRRIIEGARKKARHRIPAGWDTGPGPHTAMDHNRGDRRPATGGTYEAPVTVNKRSVWRIATHACKDAHFATFPEALVKPCVLAGCPLGGLVLDPFAGTGTTGAVAVSLGRRALLLELNPKYAAMAVKRMRGVTPGLGL